MRLFHGEFYQKINADSPQTLPKTEENEAHSNSFLRPHYHDVKARQGH